MQTNIVVDESLVAEAMDLTGIKTKRQVVDAALRTFIRLRRQRAVLDLEGAIPWEGDLDAMRTSRYAGDMIVAEGEAEYNADHD
ncbi:MAG: type II toxin-antitoxin system VapB family antitoxin [Anaerolineae bacterium]|nr:type II toxin-antitoxin system VapB family antitoxin [Anaerolineae bacterium]